MQSSSPVINPSMNPTLAGVLHLLYSHTLNFQELTRSVCTVCIYMQCRNYQRYLHAVRKNKNYTFWVTCMSQFPVRYYPHYPSACIWHVLATYNGQILGLPPSSAVTDYASPKPCLLSFFPKKSSDMNKLDVQHCKCNYRVHQTDTKSEKHSFFK